MEGGDESRALAERIKQLDALLQQKDDDLHQAAEIGKLLLENNSQLTAQIDEANAAATSKVEELEQEKFTLRRKLEAKEHMERTYLDEIEMLKSTLSKQSESMRLKIEMQHDVEVQPLKSQIATLQSELDQCHLVESQLRETVTQTELLLAETQEQLQLRSRSLNETCSAELAELNEEVSNLQTVKLALTRELTERENRVAQLTLQVESLSEQLSKKQDEVEEIQCHATANYNALLESREENQELKVELDIIKLEANNIKKKGNSLFGEVEDRRVEAERELVSMKVQHSALKKQHEMLRQQQHKLKMEVAGLLRMAGRRGDEQMTERLLQQLSQAQSETQSLQKKIHEYEERERLEPRLPDILAGGNGQASDDGSMDYMKGILSKTQSEKATLKQELHTKTLVALAESDKVTVCEKRIYHLDHEVKQLKSNDFRLRLQIEELRMKYEPDSLKAEKQLRRKRNVEQIPLQQKPPAESTATGKTTAKDTVSENNRHEDISGDDSTTTNDMSKNQSAVSVEKRRSRPLATKRASDVNVAPPAGGEVEPEPVKTTRRLTRVSDVEVTETERSTLGGVGGHRVEHQIGVSEERGVKGVGANSKNVPVDCKVQ